MTPAVCAVALVLPEKIQRIAGDRMMMAFERLMGLILVAISVAMLLRGIRLFVTQITQAG